MSNHPFRFEGSGPEYFRIWIVNILLTILTLGIYSAWATVRNKRYFYANTWLADSNFEYHATPGQILVGRVIAISVLILYVTLQNTLPAASAVLFLLLIIATPWIIWRSIRFNARMSSYKNVRFSFDGELGKFYKYLFLLPMIPFLIFGAIALPVGISGSAGPEFIGIGVMIAFLAMYLMFPYMHAKLSSYSINNYRYGQGCFEADLKPARYYAIYLTAAVLGIAVVFVLSIFGASFGVSPESFNTTDPASQKSMANMFVLFIGLSYLVILFLGSLVKAYVTASIRNYSFAQTTLGDDAVSMQSKLKIFPLWGLYMTNLLIIVLTLGFGLPWVKIRTARFLSNATAIESDSNLDSYVTQQRQKQNAIGEEMGEAFDVEAGFDVGI